MKKTVTTSHVRVINQRAVLDAIFQQESVSKAELARQLHLSKPAMAVNVAELLKLGIIAEIGEGECHESGGRKPMLLQFNKNHRYIIAVDFYYQESIFVLCNIKGELLTKFSIRQAPHQDFDGWIKMCVSAVSTLLSSQNIEAAALAAIGVSSPGIISQGQDRYISSPQFGAFNAKQLYTLLTDTFHCTVYIKNSTNAAALGEWDNGAGQGKRNLIYLSCGQGLGAGFILNNKLYEGSQVAAGEVAHFVTPATVNDTLTLENRICIDGLIAYVTEHAPEDISTAFPDAITFDNIISLWKKKDPFIREVIENIAVELGCLISNLTMTLNCDLVILGGEYLVFAPQILPRINEIVAKHCIFPAEVVHCTLLDGASNSGMVSMCREMYFDTVCALRTPKVENL